MQIICSAKSKSRAISEKQASGVLRCRSYAVADFVDNGIGFNPFALPLEVEKDTVTEGRKQHGINIRKGDVVALIEKSIDFGGECYRLDAPNPCTEVDISV